MVNMDSSQKYYGKWVNEMIQWGKGTCLQLCLPECTGWNPHNGQRTLKGYSLTTT